MENVLLTYFFCEGEKKDSNISKILNGGVFDNGTLFFYREKTRESSNRDLSKRQLFHGTILRDDVSSLVDFHRTSLEHEGQ